MKLLYTLPALLLFMSCGQQQKTESPKNDSAVAAVTPVTPIPPAAPKQFDSVPQKPPVNPYAKANVEVKTFENKEGASKGTWGYDIYMEKNLYIHQPSIPAIPGNSGFTTEAKSRKAGEFVAYKIKHNIMPPALSPQELDSLNVLH